MRPIPESVVWLFWDVDAGGLDVERDGDFILARVLEFGGRSEVRWAIAEYGLDRIHCFFREVGHPEISDRTAAFWRAFFKAEGESWAGPADWRRSRSAPWIG